MTDEEQTIKDLIMDALSIDGEHHKQWYLEEIARRLGLDIPNFAYEEGIAPWQMKHASTIAGAFRSNWRCRKESTQKEIMLCHIKTFYLQFIELGIDRKT